MGFLKASKRAANASQWQADNEAAAARQREEVRQANLTSGSTRINAAFDNFKPEYFTGVEDNVRTLGTSDLTQQFNKARESLLYALARSGMLSSSVANQSTVDLGQKQQEAAGKIDLQARDASTKVRSAIEQEREGALSQLYATENPDLAANTANAKSALILQDKPSYNPLGDIFAGVINAYDNYRRSSDNSSGFTTSASPDTSIRASANERIVR